MHASAPVLDAPALERYGFPEWKAHASPAAGTDFSYQLPGDFYVRLISVYCKLVTDGTAANREVVLSYEDAGGNRYGLTGGNTVVAASSTAYYVFSAQLTEVVATVDSSVLIPIPPLLLEPTRVFKLHVVNVQATDALTQVRTVWERFYTTKQPPREVPRSVV
ncbi:MAG TPA: hypothetical protein VNC18_17550 [Gemmatimonadaceae bacterium]|jgi:hypothetical protein|nr:hypothetical protein [Gemmatimonadaceae bacterium]